MAKFQQKTTRLLIFLYLAIFPLGQIPGLIFDLHFPLLPTLHITDALILLIAILNIKYLRNIYILTSILVFSLLINFAILQNIEINGVLYLIRFLSYIIFGYVIFNNFKSKKQKLFLTNSLLIIGITIAIVGIAQYIFLPDTRQLKYLNWDDHLGRLISTFLDPAFTGIILVFAFLISFQKLILKQNLLLIIINILLIISIGLTYSRASFLALIFSSLYLLIKNNFSKNKIVFLIISFILLIFLLPRGTGGAGVKLERLHSVYAKFENSVQGIETFVNSPLVGVGFGNICAVKSGYSQNNLYSHSCSGFDNFFITILASTGVIGLSIFLYYFSELYKGDFIDNTGELWKATLIALLIHASFTNTLFYPFVMGWMAILTAASLRTEV